MESRLAPAKHASNESLVRLAGLERPHEVFGRLKAPKGGVAPAQSGVLPAPKLNVASCASSVFLNTSVHRRGERNVRQKGICVFHATFTTLRSFSGGLAGRLTLVVRVRPARGGNSSENSPHYREAKKSTNVRDEIEKSFESKIRIFHASLAGSTSRKWLILRCWRPL